MYQRDSLIHRGLFLFSGDHFASGCIAGGFYAPKGAFFRLPVARNSVPWYNVNSPHLSNRTVMLMHAKIKDMTKGKPLPLIISFFLPLMVGNVFQQLYTAVN